jgi:OCT family organic cation transporter-like MFS transporter 4/5
MIWIYTNELYPTNLKTQAISICSLFARTIAILAPFVGNLSKIWQPLPLVLLGVLANITGSLAWRLPETKGKESMAQANRFFAGTTLPKLTSADSICVHKH